MSQREQDALDIGDKAAQEVCLLHLSLFATIAKYDDPVLPHKQLDDAICKANKTDAYFANVLKWYYQSPNLRPKYPVDSGTLWKSEETLDFDGTDMGFFIDDNSMLFYKDRIYVPASVRLITRCQQDFTPKQTARPNESTNHLTNTFESTLCICKTIGYHYYLWQNLP